jgi:hypothetical protein
MYRKIIKYGKETIAEHYKLDTSKIQDNGNSNP